MPKIKQGHLARNNKIWWGNRNRQGKFCCCNSGQEEEAVGQQSHQARSLLTSAVRVRVQIPSFTSHLNAGFLEIFL